MNSRLDMIEARLRRLIETWMSPFNQGDFRNQLAHRLVLAMQREIKSEPGGALLAPVQYTVRLNSSLVDELKGSAILENLPDALQQAARECGIHFPERPVIRLEPRLELSPEDMEITASSDRPHPGHTANLVLKTASETPPSSKDGSVFLIMAGDRTFPIRQAVTNLGRRPDNHLVLDDLRVSRLHAQIRLNRGQYVIFDLNSTGGTSVNGQRIHQHTLKPGDVISLAGVRLIYWEENSGSEQNGESTQAIQSPPPPPEELR